MTPVLRHTLSRSAIKSVLKPASSGAGAITMANLSNMKVPNIPNMNLQIDYNEALGKLTSAYRSAMGTPDYAIPPAPSEIPPVPSNPLANSTTSTTSTSTTTTAKPRAKAITDAEIESAIHPLFDYLDANNHTLASTLSRDAMQMVMAKLWKQILMTIEGLIVPPLSDKPSNMRALSDGELDIALKWLKFLRDFFYVGGDESGVPLAVLQNQKFNEILSVRIYYDWGTDDLMEVGWVCFITLSHRDPFMRSRLIELVAWWNGGMDANGRNVFAVFKIRSSIALPSRRNRSCRSGTWGPFALGSRQRGLCRVVRIIRR